MVTLAADISSLGEGLLVAVFLLCSFAAIFGLVSLRLETHTAKKVFTWARRAEFAAAGFSVVVLVLLVAAFLTDDFSIAAVGQFSSVGLPFFYKLSAVWAGSAGSLLLWSVGVFVLFVLWLSKSKTDDIRFDAIALSIGAGVCLGFSALLVFVVKPFASCPMTIDNGAGLNPLLQNFWMIIHPPLLFLGYSAFLIPFVIVSAGVFAGRAAGSAFYVQLRRWLLLGICFLGLGIITGARWSYIELGWGGYWAWDPVENASLLPLLVAVAALHSLVGMRVGSRKAGALAGKFKLWTVVLAPVPFILCLVATFITRSGILASVHAFAQSIMPSALLAFIVCCFSLWIACIIRAAKIISIVSSSRASVFGLEKGDLLFWANVILIFTAVVIGAATFWPVIWQVVTGSNSSFILTRLFYDRVISVVGIVLVFLVGLASLAGFQKRNSFIPQLLSCCIAGFVCFGLVYFSKRALLLGLACGICAFSFIAVLTKLLFNLKAGGKIGGNIAHLGLLLFVVAAGFSFTDRAVQTQLAKGGEIALGRYTIVYDSFEHKFSAGVTKVGPEIVVRKKGLAKKLWPHSNLYPGGQSTSEVAVHTGMFEDIYVSFDGVAQNGKVVITAKVKPLMFWLWFAAMLIVAGSAWAMLEGKRSVKRKV